MKKSPNALLLTLFLAIAVFTFANTVNAATLIVPDNYPNIQTAINTASAGDSVEVRDGIYRENLSFIGKGVRVYSQNGAEKTIIDGDVNNDGTPDGPVARFVGTSSVFPIITLDGFSLRNGTSGIFCTNSASPEIIDCKIFNNTAVNGAGIYCDNNASVFVRNSTISGNTASALGGGIACKFSGSVTLVNCNVVNNRANNEGAISSSYTGRIVLTNSTVSNNTSVVAGAGIGCFFNSSLMVVNSILWNNGLNEISTGTGSIISVEFSNVKGIYPGNGNISSDPKFVSATNYHLQDNSPCIDKGTNNTTTYPSIPGDDIDGDIRTANFDMGSDEFYTSSLSAVLDINNTQFNVGQQLVVKALVSNSGANDIVMDAYLEAVLPDNSTVKIESWLNITIAGGTSNQSYEIFKHTFGATSPMGAYTLRLRTERNSNKSFLSHDETSLTLAQ